MTLYELAHHPDVWKDRDLRFLWIHHTTQEQFDLLNYPSGTENKYHPTDHTNEMEYRMHFLFVHWATLKGSES